MALDEVKLVKELGDGTFTEDLTGAKLPAIDLSQGTNAPKPDASAIADQAEAEAGVESTKVMTAERVAQAIAVQATPGQPQATQPEVDAGVVTNKVVSPATMQQGITNRIADQATAEAGVDTSKLMTPERTAQAIAAQMILGNAQERTFIYDDSVAVPTGNTYNSLAALLAAGAAINGKKTILVRNVAAPTTPFNVNPGTYDLTDYTIRAYNYKDVVGGFYLNFLAGAVLSGLPERVEFLTIRFNNAAAEVFNAPAGVSYLLLGDYATIANTGTKSVIKSGAGSLVYVNIYGMFANVEGTSEVFETAVGGQINVEVFSKETTFQTNTNMLLGAAGTIAITMINGSRYEATNANFTGTFNAFIRNYIPANDAQWSATVAYGLGEIVRTGAGPYDFFISRVANNLNNLTTDVTKWAQIGSSAGEANTGTNVGAIGANVFRDKTGVTLNFRKIRSGYNTQVTEVGDEIVFDSFGGGAGSIFILDPSATPGGNVYADLALLLFAASTLLGKKTLVAMNSASPNTPIVIPAAGGPYDFTDFEIIAFSPEAQAAGFAVEFEDGCVVTKWFDKVGTKVVAQNTTAPLCVQAAGSQITEIDEDGVIVNTGAQPVFELGAGRALTVSVTSKQNAFAPTGYEIFSLTDATAVLSVLVIAKTTSFFIAGTNLVRGVASSTFNLNLYNGDVNGSTNANFSGTTNTTEHNYKSAGGGGGHVIEDEGTPVTQRPNMSFEGAGVTVTDAGGKTVVTIPGGGGSGSVNTSGSLTGISLI